MNTQSKIFLGTFRYYGGQCLQSTHYRGNHGWHMSRLLRETSHNVAHNKITVFGGTIPLLVRIMWALPMHYQGHFPPYTQDIIMEFLLKIHYYLPTLYSIVNCLPYIHLYLLILIPIPL